MAERNELPEHFALTEEQRKEIEKIATELQNKCYEFEAPFMLAICVAKDNEGSQVAEANYFNGERTPTCMAIARTVVDKNITNPLELLALIAQ